MGFNQKLYDCWYDMKRRCYNKGNIGFDNYGGRGVDVCSDWQDYHSFRDWALDNGYDKNLEIDRIDNMQGYSPSNCHFVTKSQNGRNKRNNAIVEGVTLVELSENTNISYDALSVKRLRLIAKGESVSTERLLTNKNDERSVRIEGCTLKEIAKNHGRVYKQIKARYFHLKDSEKPLTLENVLHSEKTGLNLIEGKTVREIATIYNAVYNTLRSRVNTLKRLNVPLTIDNVLNKTNLHTISQSITKP